MPRIQLGQKRERKTWQQIIVEQIKAGKALPIIGNQLANNRLLQGGHDALLQDYAAYLQYPQSPNLPQMTQYISVMEKEIRGSLEIKRDYLNFAKNKLFNLAEAEQTSPTILEEAEVRFDEVDFSTLADLLGYPRFLPPDQDPLLILADLPLPIYLTTSPHQLLEVALKQVSKQPRTEVCRWHRGMQERPAVLGGEYVPSPSEPLVYHLFGLDDEPTSLVLTEDNHMEFLVTVSKDLHLVPARVRQALTDSSLILIGYHLQNWDFRTLFWSLIKPRELKQQSVSVLQLPPTEEEKKYYQEYLAGMDFKVFWGDYQQYAQALFAELA